MTDPPLALRRLLLSAALLLGTVSAQSAPTPATSPPPATTTASTSFALSAALAQLSNAPQVAQANLSLARAQRDLDAAQAGLSLNVTVGGTASYSSAAAETTATTGQTSGNTTSGSLNLKATAGVLPWATNRTALAAAQRTLNYARALRQENIGAARLGVVEQYQNAYLAQLDLTTAAQSLSSNQQTLSAAQTQRTQGNATQESELQAQAAVQSAQAAQSAAQTALEAARRSLGAALGLDLTGRTFGTPPQLPASADAAGLVSLGLGDVNALVAQALAASSDVLQAQNTLSSAQDALAQQQRERSLPELTLSAGYGPGGSGLSGSGLSAGLSLKDGTVSAGYTQPLTISTAASSLNVTVSGSYSVFNPAASAQVASAQAQVSQSELSLTLARQSAELELRQSYSGALGALGAVAAKVTLEQRSEVALQTAQARLSAGTGTANEVVAAQAARSQALRDTQAARAAAALNILELQNSSGQLGSAPTPGGTP